jgi:fibronectin type 3 domain-containing protein
VGKNWTVSALATTTDFSQTDTDPTGSWSNSSSSDSTSYQCTNTATVIVPAGTYSSYVLATSNGNGYNSSTYYSPDAGNTVKFYSQTVGSSSFYTDEEVLISTSYAPPVVYSAPSQPLDLQSSVNGNAIDLSWQQPSKNGNATITNYKIYRGSSSGSESFLSDIGTNLSYADAGVQKGTRYYYEVTATNSVGEGPKSNEVNATVPSSPAVPSAPQHLAALAGNQLVSLSWSTPASQGSSAITGYNVYRGSSTGGEALLANTGVTLVYNDTGLVNGNTYFYEISAVNAVGEGQRSNEASATPSTSSNPPDAPVQLTPVAGNAQVSLTWSPSASGGSPANFNVYRSLTQSGTYGLVASPTSAYFTDVGLTNGQTYWYEVDAQNQFGFSTNTTPVSATPTATGNPPDVPTGLVASPGNGLVSLTWSAPVGGGTPTNYDVYRSNSQSGTYQAIASPVSTSYLDSAVTNGQTYWYEVDAHNSYGFSSNSTIASGTPSGPSPEVYSVSGHVYVTGTTTTISGATVTIGSNPIRSTLSDQTGWYSFTGLANGSYQLTASAVGYLNSSTEVVVSGMDQAKDLNLTARGGGGGTSGTNSPWDYMPWIVVILVLAVVAVVVVAVLVKRGKKQVRPSYPPQIAPYR